MVDAPVEVAPYGDQGGYRAVPLVRPGPSDVDWSRGVEDMAAAIHRAVTMDPEDRRSRMSRMRAHVREHNIFAWAGLLLAELARIPREALHRPAA